MNFHELDNFNLSDTVKYHNRLNRRLWGRDEHLLPDVRDKLLEIAEDFREFLGVDDLRIQDITLSGSNAAYNYTNNSDIDLHLVVAMPDDPVYQELFNAKKYQYNNEHNLTIGGADVELYVQPADQPHVSQGIYSVKDSKWIQVPRRKRAQIDDSCVRDKAADLDARIHAAVQSGDADAISALVNKIKVMRQTGLEQHGEFGCENIVFKVLRDQGCIKLLKDAYLAARDHELSLAEQNREKGRVTYGFSNRVTEDVTITPDGVSASTRMFLSEKGVEDNQAVNDFIQHVVKELGIDPAPEIVIHTDPEWSESNHSFGRYEPESNTLNVSMPNRHIMDVFRTIAHELVHCDQHQKQGGLPPDAGETGSKYENDANARAGIIMRDFAAAHPEYFGQEPLGEGASGYIPKNKREAAMPQYAMALSVDVKPGQTGKEANKMALQTGPNGEPTLLMKNLRNALREFKETGRLTEEQDLFEINMGSKNLRREAAKTGANAGMEFEMIVPDVPTTSSDSDDYSELEPNWDIDERASGPYDIRNFFTDRDHNTPGDVDRLIDNMMEDYTEWQSEEFGNRWDSDSEEFIYDYIKDNVDDDEIRQLLDMESEDPIGRNEYQLASEKIAADQLEPYYEDAENDARDSFFNEDMFEDWLEDSGLETMQRIYERYDNRIQWPHWNDSHSGNSSDSPDTQSIADSFSAAVGRPAYARSSYHQYGQKRPGYDDFYVVEPDGSLEANNYQIVGQDGETYKLLWSEEPLVPNKKDDEGLRKKISDQAKKTLDQWQSRASQQPDYVNQNYQIAKYDGNETPLEFVSPYMPLDKMLAELNKVVAWAKANKCTTNYKTGLHINVDVPNYDSDRLDYVKLALLMGDEYVLEQFGRTGNKYAASALGKVRDRVKARPYEAKYLLDKMKGHMGELASQAIHSSNTDKFTSINTKEKQVEFRSPGGDWLDENFDKIENTLLRFTVALSAAMDPKAYREEYLKKLYKVLNPQNLQDTYGEMIQEFANYMAALQKDGADTGGVLSKETQQAVKSFRQAAAQELKQKNIDKKLKKSGENMVNGHRWRVTLKPELGGGVVEVIATDPIHAKTQAIIQQPNWRFVDDSALTVERLDEPAAGASTTGPHPQGRGRPNDPNGRLAIVNRDDPLVFAYSSGTPSPAPDYLFRFTLGDGYSQAQLRSVLAAWAARENANAADYMIVDTTMFAAPEQTAAPESGSVRWNIINRNNEIVHSFWNRNVQADANAVAREWFYNNDMANSSDGPFEVVPAAIPGSTQDLQRQRQAADAAANTRRWADYEASQASTPAPVAGVQDIEPDVNVGATQWEVYDRSTGNPVFRMYAADQAEAWRKGQEWVANYARMTPDQPIDPADYSVRQSAQPVTEGPQDDPEDYRAHLLKTLPRMMDFLNKNVKGWKPTKKQYKAAIETGYQVMKHTGNVQQAGQAISDELNTLHRMSQSKSGMMEATGDKRFDAMMGQIQREPAIPDPQMPPTDVKDLYAWAVKNNKPYHKIFAEWANREGYKSVAPALLKAGDLDSDALDYWTPDVWKLWYGPDSEMPQGWSKDRVPDELRDYLETVFDAYENIWQDWPTEYRQIGQQGVAEGKIKLSTDPNWYGAEVGDYKASGPVVNIPANRLVGFEPDDKMNQPASKANVEKIVAGLKQGAKLPPLMVRQYKNGYQVLDGHHRFWAYKLLGVKSIPAQVVPEEDIEEITKQGVAEGTQLSPNMSVSPNQDPNSPEEWDYHYKGQQIKPGDEFHPEIKDLHLRTIDPTYDAFRNAFDNPIKPGPAVPQQPPQGDTIIPSRPAPPEKIKGPDGKPLKLKDIMQQDPPLSEGNGPGKPVVDAILKVMPVAQEIWFHGSRATGKHRKNSDTDILVIVPDDLVGDQYLGVVRILQKLSLHFDNHDIQPAKVGSNIHRVAQEEGQLLWSNQQDVDENTASGINKMFNNLGDPVFANLQRVALLAMQGRQSEAAGRLQTVIKDADPAVQKKITDAVNSIKPVTINGRVADSSTLDKSKQHNDWIINTFIPWVQSLLSQQGVAENFADGRNPQDKGDSKRHGINTKASVSSLRKTAKQGGRKGQLAHWLANMKSGRAKAKKKTNETVIGNLHFPQLTVAVDDHAIDRTRTRGIDPHTIDQSLKKLNAVADQLAQIEPNAQVWAYDAENNLGLGLRRISSKDMLFKLKTVVADRPFDGAIPIIELS